MCCVFLNVVELQVSSAQSFFKVVPQFSWQSHMILWNVKACMLIVRFPEIDRAVKERPLIIMWMISILKKATLSQLISIIMVGPGFNSWAENFTTVYLPPFFNTFVILVGKKLSICERLSTGWRYFLLFVLQWQLAIYLDEICEIKCQNHLSMQNKRVFLLIVPLW